MMIVWCSPPAEDSNHGLERMKLVRSLVADGRLTREESWLLVGVWGMPMPEYWLAPEPTLGAEYEPEDANG